MVDGCLDVSQVFLAGWWGKNAKTYCIPHDLSRFDILRSPNGNSIRFMALVLPKPAIDCNHSIRRLNIPLFIIHTTSKR